MTDTGEVLVGSENAVSSYGPNLTVGQDGVLNAVGGPENLTISATKPTSPAESDVWIDIGGGGNSGTKVYRNGTFHLLSNAPKPPIAYYTMDSADVSSGTLADASGNGHSLTIQGPTTGVSGHINEAFSFDGVDDMADAGAFFPSLGSDPVSISAWVKPTTSSPSDKMVICEWGDGSDGGRFHISIFPDGTATFGTRNSPVNGTSTIPTDSWTHLCGVYDGSGDGTGMTLYVNGSAEGTGNGTSINIAESAGLNVGASAAYGGGGQRPFNGAIDQLRFFDYELSSTEITALSNEGQ